jgi:DNA-binding beta-propeller fold protein YncE
MRRLHVYIGMALISLTTSAAFVFTYFNESIKTVPSGIQQIIDPTGEPQFSQQIHGDFEKALSKPMDTAATDSFIYVSDTNNKRVMVFDVAGSPLFSFGEEGNQPGQFNFPYGISVDPKGRVFVADLYNGSISIFDEKGKFIKFFADQYSKNQTITSPGGLRIINEKVYVTDIQANKVFVFGLDGKLLLEIGSPGSENGQFMAPNAVTADQEGNIYVVDTGNQRVQAFDKTGKFLRIINGSSGEVGDSIFVNPRGIGIDSRGIIYVVSNLTHMVYGFTKDGEQTFQFGSMGEANGQFSLPNGLFIDGKDKVYITDTLNLRVSVFN